MGRRRGKFYLLEIVVRRIGDRGLGRLYSCSKAMEIERNRCGLFLPETKGARQHSEKRAENWVVMTIAGIVFESCF